MRLYIPGWDNFKAMRNAFGEQMKIVNVVNMENEWLSGIVVLLSDADSYRPTVDGRSRKMGVRAYYYFATASDEGKRLRAPYLAAWEGMRWAKKSGCRLWDWDGVADERFKDTNTKAWKGFGEFKAKFGGAEVRYIGSYTKYYRWGKVLGWLEKINFL